MKLSKLRIRGFGNIIDTTLEPGTSSFVVLRGKNRQGKTRIAEALSLALTPTTWGLSPKGDGYARKIKRGEPKAILEADIQGTNHLVRRTVTLNTNTTGRTQESICLDDPSWTPFKFDKFLDEKKAAFGIALNTRKFMSLVYSNDEKEQKNLLAQLVLPAHYDFPKETIADVERVLGEGEINFDGEPFDTINKAYKKLFEERQSVNRKVKEFTIPDPLPVQQGVNSASLQSDLSNLRAERQKRSGERDAAVKAANEAEVRRTRIKGKIESLEALIKTAKDQLKSVEGNILTGMDLKAAQDTASWKVRRDGLLAEQRTILAALDAKKKELERFEELPDAGSTCPTCDQVIDGEKLVSLATTAALEKKRLTDESVRIATILTEIGNVDLAIAMLASHESAVKEKASIDAKLAEHTKSLKDAKIEADKDKTPAFDFAPFDKTLAQTDASIEAILQQLRPVIAAEERVKEIVTRKEQLKRLETNAALLDKLVKLFDKDGIKAKLIAQYIGSFENKINKVLREWKYSCSLSIEPWKFEVTNHRDDTNSIIELSGAEEEMFYPAFQTAVSIAAGIGFVVIDRVDTLLPELRPALFKNLFGMVKDGTLDQVILLVADTSEQVPKIPNSAFFIVDEGNVRRLG